MNRLGWGVVLVIFCSKAVFAVPIPDDFDDHSPCKGITNPARCYSKALSFFGVLCSAFAEAEAREVLAGETSYVVHRNGVTMCRNRALEASLKYRERLVTKRGGKKGMRGMLHDANQAWFNYLGALSVEEGEDMDAYLKRVHSLNRDAYVKIEELEEYSLK